MFETLGELFRRVDVPVLPEEMTVAPDLLRAAWGILRAEGLPPLASLPRVHVDCRLPAGRWHEGAPVEGPCLPGRRHPMG